MWEKVFIMQIEVEENGRIEILTRDTYAGGPSS